MILVSDSFAILPHFAYNLNIPFAAEASLMLWILLALFVLFLLWVFLIFPGRATAKARAPFEGRAFAHRGLHTMDQSVPENSLPAFRLAVDSGYGAELDIQMTRDGQVVVFHDDDLKRGCGVDGRICDLTLEELKDLRLFGSEERIPLFSEVLEIFAGREPLIVELKTAPNALGLCTASARMLQEYDGPACIESFDPWIVQYFRRNDPKRVRGQLLNARKGYRGLPGYLGFALSRGLMNVIARPHFLAHSLEKKSPSVRLCEKLGAMRVCWTAREKELHDRRMEENDAVIFEGYSPRAGKNRRLLSGFCLPKQE